MPLNPVDLIDEQYDGSAPTVLRWLPPEPPQGKTWESLAQIMCSYRVWLAVEQNKLERQLDRLGAISDAGLQKLLGIAYRASFLRDEGRPVHGKYLVRASWEPYCPPSREGRLNAVASRLLGRDFHAATDEMHSRREQQVILCNFPKWQVVADEKQFAILSQTLQSEDTVIIVIENVESLTIDGIALLSYDTVGRRVLDPTGHHGRDPGLMIEILGPGHLRVTEGKGDYSLRADEIVQHGSVLLLRPVRKWIAELAAELVSQCPATRDLIDGATADLLPRKTTAELSARFGVGSTLSGIIDQAIRLGHGGAFVVVPEFGAAPIDTSKYRVAECNIGDLVTRAWIEPEGSEGASDLAWERPAVHDWRTKIRAIGDLSATDGCVVFDRKLILHAFGGSIKVKDAATESRACIDLQRNESIPEEVITTRFGERHRSAYQLCQAVPGTIAFVVSQDGNLRLFASDEDRVYFANDLRS